MNRAHQTAQIDISIAHGKLHLAVYEQRLSGNLPKALRQRCDSVILTTRRNQRSHITAQILQRKGASARVCHHSSPLVGVCQAQIVLYLVYLFQILLGQLPVPSLRIVIHLLR